MVLDFEPQGRTSGKWVLLECELGRSAMELLDSEPQGKTSLGTSVEVPLESELELVKPLVTKGLLESYLEQGRTSLGTSVEAPLDFDQGMTS